MLTTRQRYLAAITNHWGGLNLGSFAQRLLLQKRIFFVSMLGVNLGFGHSWYIRGPYSPALTRDAYAIQEARVKGSSATLALPDDLTRKLDDIRSIFGAGWNDPQRMELLASICYLARTFRTNDVESLSDELVLRKGHFTKDEATEAFNWLADKGLING